VPGDRVSGWILAFQVSEPPSCFSFFSGESSGAGDQHLASRGVEGLSVAVFLPQVFATLRGEPRNPDWRSEILRLPSRWLGRSKSELATAGALVSHRFVSERRASGTSGRMPASSLRGPLDSDCSNVSRSSSAKTKPV
jgi:hypothetical protein